MIGVGSFLTSLLGVAGGNCMLVIVAMLEFESERAGEAAGARVGVVAVIGRVPGNGELLKDEDDESFGKGACIVVADRDGVIGVVVAGPSYTIPSSPGVNVTTEQKPSVEDMRRVRPSGALYLG